MSSNQLTILSIGGLVLIAVVLFLLFQHLNKKNAISNTADKMQAITAGYQYVPDRAMDIKERYQ